MVRSGLVGIRHNVQLCSVSANLSVLSLNHLGVFAGVVTWPGERLPSVVIQTSVVHVAAV